jgi:hypothetical protein
MSIHRTAAEQIAVKPESRSVGSGPEPIRWPNQMETFKAWERFPTANPIDDPLKMLYGDTIVIGR